MVALNEPDIDSVNTKRAILTPQVSGWPLQLELLVGNSCESITIAGQPRAAEIHFYSDNVSRANKRVLVQELIRLDTDMFVNWMEDMIDNLLNRDLTDTAWLQHTGIGVFLRDNCSVKITGIFNLSGQEDVNSNSIPAHAPYPVGIILSNL